MLPKGYSSSGLHSLQTVGTKTDTFIPAPVQQAQSSDWTSQDWLNFPLVHRCGSLIRMSRGDKSKGSQTSWKLTDGTICFCGL